MLPLEVLLKELGGADVSAIDSSHQGNGRLFITLFEAVEFVAKYVDIFDGMCVTVRWANFVFVLFPELGLLFDF